MSRWFELACSQRPLNHYQLLGLELFESRPEVIEAAATRITLFLQNLAAGPARDQADQLLQDVAAAQLCLLGPAKKAAYDAQLRAELVGGDATAGPARRSGQSARNRTPDQGRNHVGGLPRQGQADRPTPRFGHLCATAGFRARLAQRSTVLRRRRSQSEAVRAHRRSPTGAGRLDAETQRLSGGRTKSALPGEIGLDQSPRLGRRDRGAGCENGIRGDPGLCRRARRRQAAGGQAVSGQATGSAAHLEHRPPETVDLGLGDHRRSLRRFGCGRRGPVGLPARPAPRSQSPDGAADRTGSDSAGGTATDR